MGLEIEAKMKVEDLEAVRAALRRLGGIRVRKELETNTFFDTAELSLRKIGKGLRIRTAVDERGATRTTMTLKGALQTGQLKTRPEIEFGVTDAAAARDMLENLGFSQTLSFEKQRESWTWMECEVDLDELPYLGTYVEIEGKSDGLVLAARKALGLGSAALISNGYVAMLARYLEEHRIDKREIRL